MRRSTRPARSASSRAVRASATASPWRADSRRWLASAIRSTAASAGSSAASNAVAAAIRAFTAISRSPLSSSTAARRRWAVAITRRSEEAAASSRHAWAASASAPASWQQVAYSSSTETLGVVLRPQLERLPVGVGRVAVRVHGTGVGGGAQQRLASLLARVRAQPVGGDVAARRARRRQRLGERAVVGPAAGPGEVGVQRLARERVPEAAGARVELAHEPVLEQLADAVVARQGRHHREVEALARHGGDLGRLAARARELGHADQHRVADGVGQRHVSPARELHPAPPLGAARRSTRSAPASSSTKNGSPSVRSWIARVSDGEGAWPSVRSSSSAVSVCVERAQDDLLETAGPPQVVAEAPDRVLARQPVGAVDADDQQRHVADRGEHAERRLVAPLQVVEHDHRVVAAADQVERGAQRLEQRARGRPRRRRARPAPAAAGRGGRAAGRRRRARPDGRAGSRAAPRAAGRRAPCAPARRRRAARACPAGR